jgi:tRNA N6-adenosine threonylcarbamoyltransferase
MRVLGIESSCDETAAAVVEDGARILSSVVASQALTHAKYGGVVPELASREHLKRIVPVFEEALARAGVRWDGIDGIAVTEGPGLVGSLLVGVVFGKALARALGKPLVGVNHLEGHIHAVLLENKNARANGSPAPDISLPAVALVVSGGHTCLYHVAFSTSNGKTTFSYRLLGQTRDDAAGEAFDKVAKLLALGYPGGPVIDRLARLGDAAQVKFGRIKMKGNPLDFSFSGLKTAVLYRVRGTALEIEANSRRARRETSGAASFDELRNTCSKATLDLVAGFQEAVVTDLVERTLAATAPASFRTIFVTGGVACNSRLRERFAEAAKARALQVHFPSPALSTDNAAMIAAAGTFKLQNGERADVSLTAHAALPLGIRSRR